MREPTEGEIREIAYFLNTEWNLGDYDQTENDVRRALRGVIDDYQSWHPGYAGKLAVLIWSEPCFVNVVTFDDADETPMDVLSGELLGLDSEHPNPEPMFLIEESNSYVSLSTLIASNINGEIGFTPFELKRLCNMHRNQTLLCGGGAYSETLIRRVK